MTRLTKREDIKPLLDKIKKYSKQTYMHSIKVAVLLCCIKEEAEIPDNDLENYVIGGLIHDIGKIWIPLEVLEKKGRLNEEENRLIREHPLQGKIYVEKYHFGKVVENIIMYHHEREDGSGYPYQLSDDEMSKEAMIVAVCDMYEALTSERSYKNKYSHEHAMEILYHEADCRKVNIKYVDALASCHSKTQRKYGGKFSNYEMDENDPMILAPQNMELAFLLDT